MHSPHQLLAIPSFTTGIASKGYAGEFYQGSNRALSIKGAASTEEHREPSREMRLPLDGGEHIRPGDLEEAISL